MFATHRGCRRCRITSAGPMPYCPQCGRSLEYYVIEMEMPRVEPKKKLMSCISGVSASCRGKFLTTPERRICAGCRDMFIAGDHYNTFEDHGVNRRAMHSKERKSDE